GSPLSEPIGGSGPVPLQRRGAGRPRRGTGGRAEPRSRRSPLPDRPPECRPPGARPQPGRRGRGAPGRLLRTSAARASSLAAPGQRNPVDRVLTLDGEQSRGTPPVSVVLGEFIREILLDSSEVPADGTSARASAEGAAQSETPSAET